jgi:hypothetical protein
MQLDEVGGPNTSRPGRLPNSLLGRASDGDRPALAAEPRRSVEAVAEPLTPRGIPELPPELELGQAVKPEPATATKAAKDAATKVTDVAKNAATKATDASKDA